MASDKRLHPVSVLFTLGSTARELLVPGIAVLFASQSRDWGWRVGTMVLFVPYALVALGRALSFRYRLDEDELVIRSGVLFRSVRHVPYSRIHNIDAVQNVVHRVLGVAEVRIETGGGAEPEASLQVLSLAAFDELRRTVFERRTTPAAPDAVPDRPQSEGEVVLRLPPGELLLSGVIQNRGAILLTAAIGLVLEFGVADSIFDRVGGGSVPGRGVARQVVRALAGRAELPVIYLLFAVVGFVLFLLALRVVSMVWSLITLHGYTLVHQGADLRAEFGLLTRVRATTPLKRIQTVTIREGPLHRWFGRVSVRVQTAGDAGAEGGDRSTREELVPIVRVERLPSILDRLMPGVDASAVTWQLPHPRAFRRAFVRFSTTAVLLSCWLTYLMGRRWLVLVPLLVAWGALNARLYIRHLRWGTAGDAVFFKSGWLWRQTTIVRLARVQAASLHESPFDRRLGMATVLVDTFGASRSPHVVHIPYVPRATAAELVTFLHRHAAATTFST